MSTGKEEVKTLSISVSSGSGSGTSTKSWDLCRRFRVIPVAESDTYDVSVSDADGHLIMKRTSQLGTLSEIQELSLGIVATVDIANASQDGTYTVKFDMH